MGKVNKVRSRTTSIALRACADVALALLSLAAGLSTRLLAKTLVGGSPDRLFSEFLGFFGSYAPLLAVSVVVTFSLFHVYTRNRLYLRRQKLVSIAQATSLAYIVFVFVVYLFKLPAGYIPRGALLIAYAITLAGACGGRVLIEYLDKIFILE